MSFLAKKTIPAQSAAALVFLSVQWAVMEPFLFLIAEKCWNRGITEVLELLISAWLSAGTITVHGTEVADLHFCRSQAAAMESTISTIYCLNSHSYTTLEHIYILYISSIERVYW